MSRPSLVALLSSVAFAMLGGLVSGALHGADLRRTGRAQETAIRIDAEIERRLAERTLKAAPLADDSEFLRRVYLDLVGRVPTVDEASTFLASQAPDRRSKLIDALLDSREHGTYMGRLWRDWIVRADTRHDTRELNRRLGDAFDRNDPWNVIVGELLRRDVWDYATENRAEAGGATRLVGSLFMGVQLQCAECHDDPVRPWKQDEFWALAAYFRNVGDGQPGDKAGPAAITIPPTAFANAGKVVAGKTLDGRPLSPDKLRRRAFAEWLLAKENPYFARAFVNRVWGYLFAYGIVHPLDDFRDDNPPSHPALLQLLTEEFVAAGYDIKHLFRCIANSRAYQRTSRLTEAADADTTKAFGRHSTKVLTADQLQSSLRLSFADPNLELRSLMPRPIRQSEERTFDPEKEFARFFATNEADATDYNHGTLQVLSLLTNPEIAGGGKRVRALIRADVKPPAAIEEFYLATLSRRPSAEELRLATEFVTASDSLEKGYSGVLWMLVNRSEFLLVR